MILDSYCCPNTIVNPGLKQQRALSHSFQGQCSLHNTVEFSAYALCSEMYVAAAAVILIWTGAPLPCSLVVAGVISL